MPAPFLRVPIAESSSKRVTGQNIGTTNIISEDQSNILALPRRCIIDERLGRERKPWPAKTSRPDTTYRFRRLKLVLDAVRQFCKKPRGTIDDKPHRFVLDHEARRLIQQRNHSSIHAFVEHIELLPTCASSNNWLFEGGSDQMKLYSIRSRSHSPISIYLWGTPDNKVVVRYKFRSISLVSFLDMFEVPNNSRSSCFRIWQTLLQEDIGFFPPHLRKRAYQKWRSVNTFPNFMELPPEVREKIIHFAVFPPLSIMPRRHGLRNSPGNRPNMELTLVNRHIYSQTASIIYSRSIFSFWSLHDYDWFASKLSAAFRNTIRSIEICFKISETLVFLEDMYPAHRRYEGTPTRGRTGQCLRIEDLPDLRHVYVDFFQQPRYQSMSRDCRSILCTCAWEAVQPYSARTPNVSFSVNQG